MVRPGNGIRYLAGPPPVSTQDLPSSNCADRSERRRRSWACRFPGQVSPNGIPHASGMFEARSSETAGGYSALAVLPACPLSQREVMDPNDKLGLADDQVADAGKD